MDKRDPRHRLDRDRQLVRVPEREQLTEGEARRLGQAANRLARYRELMRHTGRGGSLNAAPRTGQLHGVNLGPTDLEAVLALLIEREELFLASFNVKIERPE